MGSEQVRALNGVDLTIRKGRVCSDHGPRQIPGSGQSTLMRSGSINGCLDSPSSGEMIASSRGG